MTDWGYRCELAAPSLIPTRPGDRRKHDKRDAIQLGRLYRSSELTLIHVPTEAEDQVRDLVRCRETFQREILKSRHDTLKFLRRRGFVFRGGTRWTQRHFVWIRQLLQPGVLSGEDRLVLSEYLALLEYKIARRDELDRQVERLVDFRRFDNPRKLMAYFGLVPSEHSSGDRQRQGASATRAA